MTTPSYRYLFCDLITDEEKASLELTNVVFDRRIIQPGSFRATIPVPNAQVAKEVRKVIPASPDDTQTGPGRTVVHVMRDGALWGTYLLWLAVPTGDALGAVTVEIQGASLESYLHRVEIREDTGFVAAEQTIIATTLIEQMQADPAANIGLITTAVDSFTDRDRTYKRTEAATYGQRLTELAAVDGGFEWMIRTYLNADGNRVREFVAMSQLGGSIDHVFMRPGNILTWSYTSDAKNAATSYQTRGATNSTDLGEVSEPVMSSIWPITELHAGGWPRLDTTIDYNTVTEQNTLNSYAHWWRDNRKGVVRIPSTTVRLDEKSSWTPNNLGDYARVTIADHFYPLADGKPTFAHRWRVIGCEITPVSREDGLEACTLIYAEAEVA